MCSLHHPMLRRCNVVETLPARIFRYKNKNEDRELRTRWKRRQRKIREIVRSLYFLSQTLIDYKPNDCNEHNDILTLFLGFCCILVIFIWISF